MRILLSIFILNLLFVTVSKAQDKTTEDAIINKYLKDNNIKAEKADGIYYTITQSTKLPKVKAGDAVSVHYLLKRLSKNSKIVDETIDSSYGNSPFSLVVGAGSVIEGWEIGLQKLNKGEKATLIIPSRLGYGASARSKALPANAILVFEVHVLEKNEKLGKMSFKTMQIILFFVVLASFLLFVYIKKAKQKKTDSQPKKS